MEATCCLMTSTTDIAMVAEAPTMKMERRVLLHDDDDECPNETMEVENDDPFVNNTLCKVKLFFQKHPEIKESHGYTHAIDVYNHALNALRCSSRSTSRNKDNSGSSMNNNSNKDNIGGGAAAAPATTSISTEDSRDILIASLLHDVDDRKYFPNQKHGECINALNIMKTIQLPTSEQYLIVKMISWVSGSYNGDTIPEYVQTTGKYHLLIPRWSDRIEATGKAGVIRCYDYAVECGQPLSSSIHSPKAISEKQVWNIATPSRFKHYQENGKQSHDMISHYYDKLLHVATPPPSDIIRNEYLQTQMQQYGTKYLVEVAIRFGQKGIVDIEYIEGLR